MDINKTLKLNKQISKIERTGRQNGHEDKYKSNDKDRDLSRLFQGDKMQDITNQIPEIAELNADYKDVPDGITKDILKAELIQAIRDLNWMVDND